MLSTAFQNKKSSTRENIYRVLLHHAIKSATKS